MAVNLYIHPCCIKCTTLQGEHSESSSTEEDRGLSGSSHTRELGGSRVGGNGAVGRGSDGRSRASGHVGGSGRGGSRSHLSGAGGVHAGSSGLRGRGGSLRRSGSRGAGSWNLDAHGDTGGGASILNGLDDVGLLLSRARLLDARGDGSEEGVGLLAVAREVSQAAAAIGGQGGDEAAQSARRDVVELSGGNGGQDSESSEGLHVDFGCVGCCLVGLSECSN